MDALSLTLKANALTTPDRAKALGTGLASKHDNALIFAINAVSAAIHRAVRRPLYQVTYTEESPELLQGHGRELLQLRAYPILEVTSVLIGGVADEEFSSARQFLDEGKLYREAGWPWDAPAYTDLTCDINFSRLRYNVAVAYVGGYITPKQEEDGVEDGEPLPEELEQATFREVSDLLNGARGSGRILSERTAGGYAVTYAMSGAVSLSVETQDVLSGYVLGALP